MGAKPIRRHPTPFSGRGDDVSRERLDEIQAEVIRLQESSPNRLGKTWLEFNELLSLIAMARRSLASSDEAVKGQTPC